jgi:hypothetical protein
MLLAIAVLLLAISTEGQKAKAQPENTTSCRNSPLLAELTGTPGMGLLRAYGYDLNEPWACTRINSPWVGRSILLHFQKATAQTDDASAFSAMKVIGTTHIWIIPTAEGMLETPHVESDPHNLAAFNSLLQSLAKSPSKTEDWNAIGKLYMALVGHPEVISIEAESGNPNPCNLEGDCLIAFADRRPRVNEPYTKWTLTFRIASSSKRIKLMDATRQQ